MGKIVLFAMDVDGTLTDGKIYMGNDGEAMKAFSIKDGQGIRLLQAASITPVIITARTSKIVENRARELDIEELYQGQGDKVDVLKILAGKYGVSPKQIAYIGDDLGDLEAVRFCGVTFCPSDAVPSIRSAVDHVLSCAGGDGAVREAVEIILENSAAGNHNEA